MTIVRDSFYINGEWVKATSSETLEVASSGTGELYATVPAGTVEEANLAVEAAAAADAAEHLQLQQAAQQKQQAEAQSQANAQAHEQGMAAQQQGHEADMAQAATPPIPPPAQAQPLAGA